MTYTTPASGEHGPASVPHEVSFPGRRSFIAVLIAMGTAAMGAFLAIPLVRYTLYPLFAKTTETGWSDLGPIDDFSSLTSPIQKVVTVEQSDGWRKAVSKKPVYVARDAKGNICVLSSVCPHLGCEVPWDASKQRFFCPCHNSTFASDGARISGPAPRGMDSLPSRVQQGKLQVRYEYFRQLLPYKSVMD